MKIAFYKYQGAGNDFVMIDGRNYPNLDLSKAQVAHLCDRRFGIGGDGLIILKLHALYDFEMIYFNADGGLSSMCGNGARCLVHFANFLEIIRKETTFLAVDGPHEAVVLGEDQIRLKMGDVLEVKSFGEDFILDTGSPHYVKYQNNISVLDVNQLGAEIRNAPLFEKEGINVNFVEEQSKNKIAIRTFERGVEAETLACGTGVTACALVHHLIHNKEEKHNKIEVKTQGGDLLKVELDYTEDGFKNIWLIGPAKMVFRGEIAL